MKIDAAQFSQFELFQKQQYEEILSLLIKNDNNNKAEIEIMNRIYKNKIEYKVSSLDGDRWDLSFPIILNPSKPICLSFKSLEKLIRKLGYLASIEYFHTDFSKWWREQCKE